jgi:MFS family permease
MSRKLSCSKCDYVAANKKETKCGKCGAWIRGAQTIRRLGFVLIGLGFLLVAGMGTITIALLPMILSAGRQPSGSGFNGTPEQGMMILALFGLVIAFGVAAILAGVFQAIMGRRSIWIIIAVLGLAFLLFIASQALRGSLERSNSNRSAIPITESSVVI